MNQSASMHKLRLQAALPDDILRRTYVRAFACRGGGAIDDRRRRARERRLGQGGPLSSEGLRLSEPAERQGE